MKRGKVGRLNRMGRCWCGDDGQFSIGIGVADWTGGEHCGWVPVCGEHVDVEGWPDRIYEWMVNGAERMFPLLRGAELAAFHAAMVTEAAGAERVH